MAEPQVLLFEQPGHGNIGEIHQKSRAIDPSIPPKLNAAMRTPGPKAMLRIVEVHAGRPAEPGGSRVGGAPDLQPELDFTQCLRAQLDGTGVTVVDLAPPGTETPLLRGEFEQETKGQRGMTSPRSPNGRSRESKRAGWRSARASATC